MNNKFLDAMMLRHACKEFDTEKKITNEDFNSILEIGRLSPSSFGFEPWKFLVIQNSELRAKMESFAWGAQGKLSTASHFVIILARKKPSMIHGSDYIEHMMRDITKLPPEVMEMFRGFYKQFQEKDFDLLEGDSDKKIFDWSTKQTYIALANMMTGAAYMGIDSCPMEGFDYKLTEEFIQKELNIDTNEFGVSCLVAFGYRKKDPRPKTRQNLEDITTWYN